MPGFDRCLGIPEGPGVVLPELVGVADFDTGVPGFSCCNTQIYTNMYRTRIDKRVADSGCTNLWHTHV